MQEENGEGTVGESLTDALLRKRGEQQRMPSSLSAFPAPKEHEPRSFSLARHLCNEILVNNSPKLTCFLLSSCLLPLGALQAQHHEKSCQTRPLTKATLPDHGGEAVRRVAIRRKSTLFSNAGPTWYDSTAPDTSAYTDSLSVQRVSTLTSVSPNCTRKTCWPSH